MLVSRSLCPLNLVLVGRRWEPQDVDILPQAMPLLGKGGHSSLIPVQLCLELGTYASTALAIPTQSSPVRQQCQDVGIPLYAMA